MKTRHTVLVLLVMLLTWSARAQHIDPSVISSGGGFAESERVSVSWTIGQTAVDLRKAHFGSISEGFQQAFLTVIPIRERSIPLSLNLYPNPARTSVLVTMDGIEDDITLVLYTLLGEAVQRQQVRGGDKHARLSFQNLPNGLYLLVAFSGSGEQLALYKIVKAD
ncbi:MAG: T9SS type A sorting domain-containing protein [Bacteroidetes bacterium]|nr:T9SS type A sorting domain-containing protein [Bacteroidota bacterium]